MKKTIIICTFLVLILVLTGSGVFSKKDTKCDDCVTSYDFTGKEAKILLGDKTYIVKTEEIDGKYSLIFNGKEIKTLENGSSYFSKLYVFDNNLVLITTDGDEYRTNHNYFYNKDLEEVSIDLTLDKSYPNSMVQLLSSDLEVEDNKIIIKGSRLNENLFLIGEDGKETKLCKSSGNPTDYTKEHEGQLLEAKYEAEYLGNYKFSSFKKIEDLRVLNEEICFYD